MADTYTPAEMAAAILAIPGGGNEMPTGAVMYYAGLAAPDGWLECDGTVYNIADYPALAAFFETNYGANNYWGGDGTTTFGVPDWQGEFLRASGTNAHENQGSGAAVGTHQDATLSQTAFSIGGGSRIKFVKYDNTHSTLGEMFPTFDSYSQTMNKNSVDVESVYSVDSLGEAYPQLHTSRPTNTSLLVCIKT